MNARILLFLLLMSIVPYSLSSMTLTKRISRVINLHESIRLKNVSVYSFTAEEIEEYLIIRFEFSMNNAEITIKDQTGNIIYYEKEITIYENKIISIAESNSYPYYVEVKCPFGSITGEIIQEEI